MRLILLGLLALTVVSPAQAETPPEPLEAAPETPPEPLEAVPETPPEPLEAAPETPPEPLEAVPETPPEPLEAVPEAVPEAAPEAADVSVVGVPVALSGHITSVRFVGLRRVEEAALMAAVGIRPGELVSSGKIRRDLVAIYETGFIDDVQVDVSPAEGPEVHGQPPVVVTFEVVEKPAIRDTSISGNKKIDEEGLREVIDIPAFAVLNQSDINENIARMRDKYLEKGFYLVEIEPIIHEVGDDTVELEFAIKENKKVRVQRIDIVGNKEVSDRVLKKFMATKEAGIMPWLSSKGLFNEGMIQADTYLLRQVFMEHGFVDVKVEPATTYLSKDKRFVYATIHVTEGPHYKLGRISIDGDFEPEKGLSKAAVRRLIEGATAHEVRLRYDKAKRKAAKGTDAEDPPPVDGWDEPRLRILNLERSLPLKTGDDYKLSTLQAVIAQITDLYGEEGYAFANVSPMQKNHAEEAVVDINFQIDKGERMWIGRIDITGNDPTYDKVIRREIPLNEGELYSTSKIKEAQMRLKRTGFFENVAVSTPKAEDANTLDMMVDVTEQPTGSFSIGAGFSNLENFVFTASVQKNNFLGMGYIMAAAANISGMRQSANFQIFDPYFLDSRWTLRMSAYLTQEQFIEDQVSQGGSFGVGRYLDPRDDHKLEVVYSINDSSLIGLAPYKERMFGGHLYDQGVSSSGGLVYSVDKRNNRINATKGFLGTLSSTLTGGWRANEEQVVSLFGGDFNYYELKANLRTYYPLVKSEALIFKYNVSLGHMGSTDGQIIPWSQRYKVGGITSIRGYDWYSLGPSVRASGYRAGNHVLAWTGSDDPTAADDRLVIGGTRSWINNFEIEAPIVRQAGISTVVFFDAGNAYGDVWGSGAINAKNLRSAYGFGIRWFSPMGPLRFEWGFPINPREDERRVVFDFSMGSLF
jgi:outer membrane protein insertion porin family